MHTLTMPALEPFLQEYVMNTPCSTTLDGQVANSGLGHNQKITKFYSCLNCKDSRMKAEWTAYSM